MVHTVSGGPQRGMRGNCHEEPPAAGPGGWDGMWEAFSLRGLGFSGRRGGLGSRLAKVLGTGFQKTRGLPTSPLDMDRDAGQGTSGDRR